MAGEKAVSHRQAKVAPQARAYGAALAACLQKTGASQRDLAAFTYLSDSAVSNYLSGVRIAPKDFVGRIEDFVVGHTGSCAPQDIEHLHDLRRAAQTASQSAEVRLAVAKEEIERLTKELNDVQQKCNASPRSSVHDLEHRLRESAREVADLKRQLEKVKRDLEAERRRAARAEPESAGMGKALVTARLSRGNAAPRPRQAIAHDQQQTDELLGQIDVLRNLVHQLGPDRDSSTRADSADSAVGTDHVKYGLFRRPASASSGLRWTQQRPLQVYSWSSAVLSSTVLCLNLAAFIATCRSDTGLTLGQLNAYAVLVFPLALVICLMLVSPGIWWARHRHMQTDVYRVLAVCAAAAVFLGIIGSIVLPPVSWVGRAWARSLGLL
ncbi:hypothetical protein AB0H69_04815 [Streptomyces phaeochromogenes]|uniref:hypothetical protein n=1 Tax=Streptomyces phaeochromogenes TaxID=1923 RepID=UPI0033F861DC